MRSHAKASSAGSTARQADGLGSLRRGALATRGFSSDAKGSGAPAAGSRAFALILFAALLGAMALIVAPASATKSHPFKETFGSAAQPSFSNPRGIAVDQSSGDVLVMDAAASPAVKRYNPDGTPADFPGLGTNAIDGQGNGECPTVPADCDQTPENGLGFASASESQIAVDNSGTATDGNIYVTQSSPNAINVFSSEGKYLGQLTQSSGGSFSEACGVAVDSTGAVYVGDYSGGIHKYVPAANPPVNGDNSANFTSTAQPCTLAAGAGATAGFLFPAQYGGPISKIDSSTGELKYTVSPDSYTTVSVDPSSGHVYGANSSSIKEFDASGAGSASGVWSTSLDSSVNGIAIRGSSGNLYVSRNASKLEVLGPLVDMPSVSTGSASGIGPTSATLNGIVNPEGVALEECKFEYGPSTSYGQSIACAQSPGAIGAGSSNVAVSAEPGGLSLGATYHFRLVAKNPNGTVNGSDQTFKLQSPPVIKGAWSQDVTLTDANLKAKVNPEGFATTYKFKWGATVAYGNETEAKAVGSDKADHSVGSYLEGLQPGTTYHYRLIATNSIGSAESADLTFTTFAPEAADTECANQAFRIGAAATLPDCRAYEMVSPVDKNGSDIKYNSFATGEWLRYDQAAADGERLTYSSFQAFGDAPSGPYVNQYLSSRGANGWSTHGISAPLGETWHGTFAFPPLINPYSAGFSENLDTAWVFDPNKEPLTPDATGPALNFYWRDNTDDTYHFIAPYDFEGGPQAQFYLQGSTADRSQMILANRAIGVAGRLYGFADGQIRQVSVLPDGTPFAGGASLGTGSIEVDKGVSIKATQKASLEHALSADGKRAYWTSADSGPGILYLRENPAKEQSALNGANECTEPEKACTIPVSQTVGPEPQAEFWAATPEDGARALFSYDPDDINHNVGPARDDLYEFDAEAGTSTLLAQNVIGVLGASDDLSYIYFVSKDDLAPGATAGQRNLYLDHGGSMTFIAGLAGVDLGEFGEESGEKTVNGENAVSGYDVASLAPFNHASSVSPDGRHLAFQSIRSLTGYDNTDVNNGEPDLEVYAYGADADQLFCASCNPSGARPTGKPLLRPYNFNPVGFEGGPVNVGRRRWTAAWIPTWPTSLADPRPLSEDGKVFFNSFDALLPRDGNGAQDVYEWEPQGVGSCDRAGGCLSLISSGESPGKSELIGASADGRDVFFETESSLLPQDTGLNDMYDARTAGGFPQPVHIAACEGEGCQNAPEAPDDATPASLSFQGAGNVTEGSAQKKRQKKKAHKKSHKKPRHRNGRANHNRRAAR